MDEENEIELANTIKNGFSEGFTAGIPNPMEEGFSVGVTAGLPSPIELGSLVGATAVEDIDNDDDTGKNENGSPTSGSGSPSPTPGNSNSKTSTKIMKPLPIYPNDRIDLNSRLVERKRYVLSYKHPVDRDWRTELDKTAKNGLELAVEVYQRTPGQGILARDLVDKFESNMEEIAEEMADAAINSKYAVIKDGIALEHDNIVDIEENIPKITPWIYKKIEQLYLEPAIIECNTAQKKYNKQLAETMEKKKLDLAIRLKAEYQMVWKAGKMFGVVPTVKIPLLFTPKLVDVTKIVPIEPMVRLDSQNIHNDFVDLYEYYSDGKIRIASSTSTSGSKSDSKSGSNDFYIDKNAVRQILAILNKILNLADDNVDIVAEMLSKLNEVYKHYMYKDVSYTLDEFRRSVNELYNRYEAYLQEAEQFSTDDDDPFPTHDETTIDPKPVKPKPVNPTDPKPVKPTNPDPSPTPTTPPTNAPTTPPTEKPTERPTEQITQPTPTTPPTNAPTNPPTNAPTNPQPQPSGYTPTGGGGSDDEVVPTETPTAVVVDEDVIVPGRTYKLPTSSKPVAESTTTTTSKGGSSVIPVLAGLAAAAAAGVGAKAYIDRKNNRDNEENEEFKAEDWSGNTEINMEYEEPEDRNAETLDFDEPGYQEEEPERYGAKTSQDLEKLQ